MNKNSQVRAPRKGDRNIILDSLLLTNKIVPDFYSKEVLGCLENVAFRSILIDNILCGITLIDDQVEPGRFSIFDLRMFLFGYMDVMEAQTGLSDESLNSKKKFFLNEIVLKTLEKTAGYSESGRGHLDRVLVLGPEKRNLAVMKAITKRGFKVDRYEDRILETMDPKCFRLILANGYEYRIPAFFLDYAVCPIVNLHPTFLPYGKGIGTTLYTALLDQPFGVSMHFINSEEIDVGPVIFRKRVSPSRTDTTRSFYSVLMNEVDSCFADSLDDLLNFDFIGIEQDKLAEEAIGYFSRENFENFIRLLPDGYDTQLTLIKSMGYIMRSNRQVLEMLQSLSQR